MKYEEFKQQEDLKWAARRKKLQQRGDKAYNKGLWSAVKWNPFKWWVFLLYRREI